MTDAPENIPDQTLHRQVWELLPWYVNRTLSAEETPQVQNHLAQCPLCQAELRRCREIAEVVRGEADAGAWVPSAQQFDHLLARVKSAELLPGSTPWRRFWKALTASWEPFRLAPPPARWALAGQAGLLLLASGLLALQFAGTPGPSYRTVSDPVRPVADRVRVTAVFAADFSVGELQALLLDLQAGIERGPSSQGVYVVTAAAGSNAAAREKLVEGLRAHPKVLLAEPATNEARP